MKFGPLKFRGPGTSTGMFLFFGVLFTALALFVPYFLTWNNMLYLTLSVSLVGMVACSMLFCLASGEFDLSVEGTVVLSGVLCAVVIGSTGSVFLGVVAGLAAGFLVGLINGFFIAKLKINALITTLAVLYIVRGLSFTISNGRAVPIDDEAFFAFGNGSVLGIPNPVLITVGLFLVFGVLLNRTTFGRETLAVGGDKEAARMAGIDVDRVKIVIFAVQGVVAAGAGIVLASRMTSGQPNSSTGFALDVIAACMLGGVSHTKGTGTIRGVAIGVLIMGTAQNAMNLIGIPSFYQYLTKGTILLLAVLFDRFNSRGAAWDDLRGLWNRRETATPARARRPAPARRT
jgi:L-arabinose transport system permease protein